MRLGEEHHGGKTDEDGDTAEFGHHAVMEVAAARDIYHIEPVGDDADDRGEEKRDDERPQEQADRSPHTHSPTENKISGRSISKLLKASWGCRFIAKKIKKYHARIKMVVIVLKYSKRSAF